MVAASHWTISPAGSQGGRHCSVAAKGLRVVVGKADSPPVSRVADCRSRRIEDRVLDRILLSVIMTATTATLRASQSRVAGGKQAQLPAGNRNASVAASSTLRSWFPERWCQPSLNCCYWDSVLIYPILFSVTDGLCSEGAPETNVKNTWASSPFATLRHRSRLTSARRPALPPPRSWVSHSPPAAPLASHAGTSVAQFSPPEWLNS